MAGQARNRGTRDPDRSDRDARSWPVLVVASAAGSGSRTAPTPTTIEPTSESSIATRSTYRTLVVRGLAPEEAASLTAFLCGFPAAQGWKLNEVNNLLFLRELARAGRFDQLDGSPSAIH